MTIQHTELSNSRSGTDATDRESTAELVYSVWGSTNLETIQDYMVQNDLAPIFYSGLVYKSLQFEHNGVGSWEFTASYHHPDKSDKNSTLDLGSYTFSFDTGGGMTTRFVSLATTKYAKSGETAPDFKGAINVDIEEGVQGVEVGVQALKLTIRKRMPRTTITMPYVKLLSDMTNTWNDAAFLGFESGELLFLSATGQQATDSDPEIEYNFIASPNVVNLTVGDITVATKRGHDYLWTFFEKIEDGTANTTVQQPKAAYVEQVLYSSNFALLGI